MCSHVLGKVGHTVTYHHLWYTAICDHLQCSESGIAANKIRDEVCGRQRGPLSYHSPLFKEALVYPSSRTTSQEDTPPTSHPACMQRHGVLELYLP